MSSYTPEACHDPLLASAPRILAFTPTVEYTSWRTAVAAKLRELVGIMPDPVAPEPRIEYVHDMGDYTDTRFIFTAEANADVPCHLLTPKAGMAPCPVMICLQGHSTGMHISLGRPKYDGDAERSRGDGISACRQRARGMRRWCWSSAVSASGRICARTTCAMSAGAVPMPAWWRCCWDGQ